MKVCDAAIQFFDDNANAGDRFKFTIDRVGKEKFEKALHLLLQSSIMEITLNFCILWEAVSNGIIK